MLEDDVDSNPEIAAAGTLETTDSTAADTLKPTASTAADTLETTDSAAADEVDNALNRSSSAVDLGLAKSSSGHCYDDHVCQLQLFSLDEELLDSSDFDEIDSCNGSDHDLKRYSKHYFYCSCWEKGCNIITKKTHYEPHPHYWKVRGHVTIINMKEFRGPLIGWAPKPRTHTDKDAYQLTLLFMDLGFAVDRYDNPGKKELDYIIKQNKEKDYNKLDISCCIVLSHGSNGGQIEIKDGKIRLDDLIISYRRNETLAGKPKMFIIQTCRGEDSMYTVKDCVDGPNGGEEGNVLCLPCEADFLFAYATVDGKVSWSEPKKYSWFIRNLVDTFREHGDEMSVVSMLHQVNRKVANMEHLNKGYIWDDKTDKQIPCIVSQLRYDLFLGRSKNLYG